MSIFSLSGKRAIVTGGGSGIGRAISEQFSRAGAEVFILDANIQSGQETIAEINDAGGKAEMEPCDITDQGTVLRICHKVAKAGNIDILVNNAGIAHIGNVINTSLEDLQRVLNVNVVGMYNCIHACIPKMKAQGGGVILNIASTVSSVAIPNRFAYTTSKGAVLAMTYSVALDFIKDKIRCNALSPGRVHTPFVDGFIAKNYPDNKEEMFRRLSEDHPIGRMAEPNEIAYMALFLCSDEAAYITGSNHQVDGGFVNLRP